VNTIATPAASAAAITSLSRIEPPGWITAVAPAATADGRLVVVNDRGDDVQVLALGRAQARLAWFGHPGGTVVAVGTAGELVVATTARRHNRRASRRGTSGHSRERPG